MKLLDLMGCQYVDLGSYLDDGEQLKQLYLQHCSEGKQLGYTPIIMDRNMELGQYDWKRFGIPEKVENYHSLVKTILEKAGSRSYEDWEREVYEKYFLDLSEDDDEVYERSLCSELLRRPTDEEYETMIKGQANVDLQFARYNRTNTGKEACQVHNGEVMAFIPTVASYEALAWIPIGGFNSCPTAEYQVAFARHMHECFGAEILKVDYDLVVMYMNDPLTDKEKVIAAARDLTVMDNDLYQDLNCVSPPMVFGKQFLSMWWD